MLRRIVPRLLKRRLKLTQRAWTDRRSGLSKRFASQPARGTLDHSLSLVQPILNATDEQSRINKIHNINIAARRIEAIDIAPGEVFSFWHTIGAPSRKNGFRPGVNIIDNKVVEDYGGGLCQLSGILYHLALMAGLTVVERANHSIDLYHDQERYTPLGADCAVFYGYKDLRLSNEKDQPVRFRFDISDEVLVCYIDSSKPLEEHAISFETKQIDKYNTIVETARDGQVITQSRYKKKYTCDRAYASQPATQLSLS